MWRLACVSYRAVFSLGQWVERRFTRAGLLALGMLIVAGVLGIDTSLTVAYRLFSLCLVLLSAAMLMSWFVRAQVRVEPEVPHTLTAGEPFALRLNLRNLSGRPIDGLQVRAELSDARPDVAQMRERLRLPSYRGWARLLWSNRMAYVDEAGVPALPADGEARIELNGRALQRGRLRVNAIAVARSDPLGLVRRLTPAAGPLDICVLPKRYRLPAMELPGARRFQPGGLSHAASVGDSEEFLGLRDYRPGDPLQRIHWRSFARAGKPVVREYQDEYVTRYALVLDTFAPTRIDEATREAFEEAVAVAASFAWTIDTQECLLDLLFAGREAHAFTAGRGALAAGRLLEALSGVRLEPGGDFAVLSQLVSGRREQLSGCICVLLGWDEQRAKLIEGLRRGGVEVRALVVSADEKLELPPLVEQLVPGRIAEGLAAL